MPERTRLRATFEEVAELYDLARPAYPPALLDELVSLAAFADGSRVVEIGPGTGQATIPLAERGIHIVAVELGDALARVARRKLAPFPSVEVVRADFEQWEPPRRDFDGVVVFTAFHWLDPATRSERCARLLRAGGTLAVVKTQHVTPPGSDPFFAAVQDAYVRAGEPRADPILPDAVADDRDELLAGGHFAALEVRRYLWDVEYDARSYIDVLDTYSGHRAMRGDVRERLYDEIRALIGDGGIRKTYLGSCRWRAASDRDGARDSGTLSEPRASLPERLPFPPAADPGGEEERPGDARAHDPALKLKPHW